MVKGISINIARSKSIISQAVYITLNLLLVVAVFGLVVVINSPVLACVLVVLSKWRIFAVRPRYWWANLRSNALDLIVGVSFALLIHLSGGDALVAQSILAVLYAAWLLVLKPSSKSFAVEIQAGVALFLGLTVLVSLTHNLHSAVLVISSFFIGYIVANHVLSEEGNTNVRFVSFIVGLLLAELSWIAYHWLVAYTVPGTMLRIPQLAIIATISGFAALSVYRPYRDRGKLKLNDFILPVGFAAVTIFVIIVFFSKTTTSL